MRLFVSASFLVFAASFYMRALFPPDVDFRSILLPMFVQSLGLALFVTPIASIIFSSLGPRDIANASSLSNCIRVLASSVGSSLATTMWERLESLHHVRLTEHITSLSPSTEQGHAWIADEITRQGFLLGFNELFWLGALIFTALAGLIWLTSPSR